MASPDGCIKKDEVNGVMTDPKDDQPSPASLGGSENGSSPGSPESGDTQESESEKASSDHVTSRNHRGNDDSMEIVAIPRGLSMVTPTSVAGLDPLAWALKVKEYQTAEQLAKLQDQDLMKNGGGLLDKKCGECVDKKGIPEVCVVCGDKASGRHYGAVSCEGCKGFFKRSIRKQLGYACRGNRDCEVTKHHRNRCQYCRLQKCLIMGMRADSVQSERKPVESKEKMQVPSLNSAAQRAFSRKDLGFLPGLSFSPKDLGFGDQTNTTDLSTLASVVTTLVSMKQEPIESTSESRVPPTTNGESKENSSVISKAFDTMAKVVLQQHSSVADGVTASDPLAGLMDSENESLFELEGPLLLDCHMIFNLTTPNPGASFLNVHYICESASRLLFLSIHWARSIPAFQLLLPEVQVALIRSSWSELFTLGLAQCSQIMSLSTILTAIVSHLQSNTLHADKVSSSRIKQVTEHICKLQDFVNSMQRLQIDEHEYAYLKAIALFSPDHPSLPSARQVEKFQEKAYQELRNYIVQGFPENNDRFPKLLLRLPALRALQASVTEELFFAGLIGNVQIDSIIPYILKMDSSEYTPDIGSGMMGPSPSERLQD